MQRKNKFTLISGLLSFLAVIFGASVVFQSASTAHAIALIAGSFGAGATVTSQICSHRQESRMKNERIDG